MSKSAPVTPARGSQELDSPEPRSTARFSQNVSVRFFDNPKYPQEMYRWEDPALHKSNKANASDDEQKERSDDEEAVSDDNPAPYDEGDESDYEGYDSDEGECDSDYESDEYPEPEDEHQGSKRTKITTLSDSSSSDYIYWLPQEEYEASDEQSSHTSLGKRNRDEFEKSQYETTALSNAFIAAFEANVTESEYYSENSDYEAEQEAPSLPAPLNPGAWNDSSSASCSPSDSGSPISPASLASPLPSDEQWGSGTYAADKSSPEDIAALRESGTAPRGLWEEEEDDLCQHFYRAVISQDIISVNAVKPACVASAVAPTGEGMPDAFHG